MSIFTLLNCSLLSRVMNATSGVVIQTMSHGTRVNDLAVTSKHVISAGSKPGSTQQIFVWDALTGAEFEKITLANFLYALRVQVIGNSINFAAAMLDRSIIIYEYTTGSQLKTLANAHTGVITGLAYIPDMQLLVRYINIFFKCTQP
jgi:WD40 repeat protein